MDAEAFCSNDDVPLVGFPRSWTMISVAVPSKVGLLMCVVRRRLNSLALGELVAAATVIADRRRVQIAKEYFGRQFRVHYNSEGRLQHNADFTKRLG